MGLDYLESRVGDGQGLFVRWWGGNGILEAGGASCAEDGLKRARGQGVDARENQQKPITLKSMI